MDYQSSISVMVLTDLTIVEIIKISYGTQKKLWPKTDREMIDSALL